MARPFAISRSETFEWVANPDDPPDQRVVFKCRTLTGGEQQEVLRQFEGEGASADGRVTLRGNLDACRKAVEFALTGWANFTRPDGKPEEFRGAARAINILPPSVVLGLGAEIIQRSSLGDAEGKA